MDHYDLIIDAADIDDIIQGNFIMMLIYLLSFNSLVYIDHHDNVFFRLNRDKPLLPVPRFMHALQAPGISVQLHMITRKDHGHVIL